MTQLYEAHPRSQPLRCDGDEVRRTFNLFIPPGGVTELRALDATVRGSNYRTTYYGYFNDADKFAEAVALIISALAIYFVPNPVNPDLLARSVNAIRPAKKDPLTADKDIVRRRYLLVDADPIRPSGISSSEEEHDNAIIRVQSIAAALVGEGLPEPIIGDSGNGGHAIFPIDEPADDEGLIERCLTSLAKDFDGEGIKIDGTTFNPARIWKLYGTIAGKGDPNAASIGRPHRMARILSVPKGWNP